jgi:inorganic pyrophosphatase
MDLSKVPIGPSVPYEVNVIIEIPMGGNPVKYELDNESGAMHYPCNYGFIPYALSDDDGPIDAAVLGQTPVQPGVPSRHDPSGSR